MSEPGSDRTVSLDEEEGRIHLDPPLHVVVATEILKLFRWSLRGTLVFAALMAAVDAFFIHQKIITPEQRLMTGSIVLTFVTATVVQVGAALAAIVFAVFKHDKITE